MNLIDENLQCTDFTQNGSQNFSHIQHFLSDHCNPVDMGMAQIDENYYNLCGWLANFKGINVVSEAYKCLNNSNAQDFFWKG